MSKKKDEPEEQVLEIPKGCEVSISGINFSICLKSTKGENLKQMTILGLNLYEHLLTLSDGIDPGVI